MLAQRLDEYKHDILKGKLSTALSIEVYANANDLQINSKQSRIIKPLNTPNQVLTIEALKIIARQKVENILNEKPAQQLSSAWIYTIGKN